MKVGMLMIATIAHLLTLPAAERASLHCSATR